MTGLNKAAAALIIGMTCLAPQLAFTHVEGHGEILPPTNEQIIATAVRYVEMMIMNQELIEGAPLPEQWKEVSDKRIFSKTLKSYVVSFTDSAASKTLYIKMDHNGNYIDANFSGTFANN